ncbi:HupE/UreJ family protein [Rubripirellula obstinata]|nr:HupE/UreJ family protein [Rubripirellula obstinata]
MAFKPSDSYLNVDVKDKLEIRWDIALRDLEMLVGLDSNTDGQITWGEVRRQQEGILGEAVSRLKIMLDDTEVPVQASGMKLAERSDGMYAVLELNSDAIERFTLMEINYDFFFDVDRNHRCVVRYNGGFGSGSYVIGADEKTLIIPEGGTHWFYLLLTYVRVGIQRVWSSVDTLVFLVALLLPSVWQFEEKRLKYVPADGLKPSLMGVFWVVTSLTVAQAITLWHSVYGFGGRTTQWIWPSMAILIVLSALHNMYPTIRYWVWIAAIAFGLMLGIEFGEFFLGTGLPSSMLPVSLLGFSIGVEFALFSVVAVLFPIAFSIRRTNAYDQYVFHGGSTLIVILGTVWGIERLSGSTILSWPAQL